MHFLYNKVKDEGKYFKGTQKGMISAPNETPVQEFKVDSRIVIGRDRQDGSMATNLGITFACICFTNKGYVVCFQSGLLMSVIRTLSASESNEQRDREKAKLEKEYKRSDQKLDELVSLHDQDLTQVMQVGIWNICESIHMILKPSMPVLQGALNAVIIAFFPVLCT